MCAANNTELEVQWIPRNELERADFISRIIDTDDWQISDSLLCPTGKERYLQGRKLCAY